MKGSRWIGEPLLRLAVADREAYEGLLGDLHEEAARSSRAGAATAGRRQRHRYNRVLFSLAASYLADRLRRRWRGDGAATPSGPSNDPRPRLTASIAEDFRHAARLVRRRAAFSGAVVATLGLGFGAAAAVLSVAYGVWLRPLPFEAPENLVRIYEVRLEGDAGSVAGDAAIRPSALDADVARRSRLSPPLLEDLRLTHWESLSGIATMSSKRYEWQREDRREQVTAVMASRGSFAVLGLRPLRGRSFSEAAGAREVIIGEALWQRAFGGAAEVIGKQSMMLDGDAYLIVGVIADDLPYPEPGGDVWTPLDFSADELSEGMRGARYLDVVGRLRPGADIAAARGELNGFVSGLGDDHPNHAGWGATATPLRADLIRPYVNILRLLVAGAAMFLLIACSNVAGLVAARRVKDRGERGVRLALGASRLRVLRQEIAEMLLLAGAAALAATLLARWSLTPLRRLAPADIPRIADISLDATVMATLAAGVLLAGVLVALIGHLLAGGGRRIDRGSGSVTALATRGRSALMIGQVALTTLLLLGGAMLGGHFIGLARVDSGFVADGVQAAPLLLSEAGYPSDAQRLLFFEEVIEALQRRGHEVAFGVNPPVGGSRMRFGYRATPDMNAEQHWGQYHVVSEDYFDVLGIPLIAGRAFNRDDRAGDTPVVIISEALARQHFDDDPVGHEMIVVGTVRQIVGVVGAVRHFGPDREPPAEMYLPLAQDPWLLGHVVLRPGDGFSPDDLREVVAAIDPGLSVAALAPYNDFVRTWFAPLRFQLTVVALLAVAGTLLAIFGLYALVAYVVAGRTREIGIRVALGETSRSVFARVVGRGLALAGGGIALGIAVALAFRATLLSLADGVQADNPLALVVVAVVVLVAAFAATAWPARRAASVDPVAALRNH